MELPSTGQILAAYGMRDFAWKQNLEQLTALRNSPVRGTENLRCAEKREHQALQAISAMLLFADKANTRVACYVLGLARQMDAELATALEVKE